MDGAIACGVSQEDENVGAFAVQTARPAAHCPIGCNFYLYYFPMSTFARVRTGLWFCLSISICLGLLSTYVVAARTASLATIALIIFWLVKHKTLLKTNYLADESLTSQAPHPQQVQSSKPRLKDLAPGLVLIGGTLIYIGYEISRGTITTRTLQLIHSILGVHASIALMVFLGTFLSIRGAELIIGSRAKK